MKKLILGLVAGLLIGSVGTAAANSPTVQAVFQKFVLQVEDKQHNIEPLVYQGTTYLPVRQVADLLNYDVKFTGATKTIQLNKGADSVNNVVTDEWIGLKELVNTYDVNVTGNLNDEMIIKNSVNQVHIMLPIEKKGTYSFDTESGTIRLRFSDGITYINLNDLKALELIQ